jgi:hypothetical protein
VAQAESIGPVDYPPGVNPLTGLALADPSRLEDRPLLIKVSNESPMIRPQSGLMSADHVWEYHMEGWGQTRYTAVFLSQYPERVGSVRSIRLIDLEVLLPMYDGLLAYSGGSIGMNTAVRNSPYYRTQEFHEEQGRTHLQRIPNVPYPDVFYYHTLFAFPEQLRAYAAERGTLEARRLPQGLVFNPVPPEGGTPTAQVVVNYPGGGPLHRWTYDPASGRWLSSTEDERQRASEEADTDFNSGERLAFDNVLVLYAEHYLADFIEDEPNQLLSVGIHLDGEGPGYLLRDGQRYPITWRRQAPAGFIHLYDANNLLISLKPGTIWFSTTVIGKPFDLYTAEVDFLP